MDWMLAVFALILSFFLSSSADGLRGVYQAYSMVRLSFRMVYLRWQTTVQL